MQIHDVSEYVYQQMPKVVYYIDQLLPQQGSLLLYGSPGIKKSWLAEYMGFCIATGTEWLGFPTTQARVLIANFEISSIGYYWRLRDMVRNFELQSQVLYECSPGMMPLEDRETFNRFAEDIRPCQPNVIILDCIQACYGGNENATEEVSVFMRNLKELCEEHQASLVLVHHTNKNPLAFSPMAKSRGSTKFPGIVDTVIYMARQPTGVQIQFDKHRLSTVDELHPLNVNFTDYNWVVRNPLQKDH